METNTYNANTTATATTTSSSGPGIGLDKEYLRTIPGILHIAASISALIFSICSSTSPWVYHGGGLGAFIGWAAFIGTAIIFFLYFLRLLPRLPLIPAGIIIMIYLCFVCGLTLIAFIISAANAGVASNIKSAAIASAVFAIPTAGCHGALLFFSVQKFRLHGPHYHKQECGWSSATSQQNFTATEEYPHDNPPAYGHY